jgi:hypothetical protein
VGIVNKWSLAAVRNVKLQMAAASAVLPEQETRDEAYHPEAALVTQFFIDIQRFTNAEALRNLIADSMLVDDSSGVQYWSLKSDVRKRVLRTVRTVPAMRGILNRARRPVNDTTQQVIEAWIEQRAKPLDKQSAEELSATLQVIDWMEGTDLATTLPPADVVRGMVERQNFLRPFKLLVGDHFRGRKIELAALDNYVNGSGEVHSLKERPPLLIHGPGGMGKSTLVAKFILEVIDQGSAAPPVVYLDCDRPGLVAEEPVTMLAEAVRQLGLQFPGYQRTAQSLRAAWLEQIASQHSEASDALESVVLESGASRGRDRFLEEFGVFVDDLDLGGRPVLLVIDTFEELQYRSRDFVDELFQFLDELQVRLPRLRTVLSGRNPVPDFAWEPLKLRELDQEAAQGYLEVLKVESPQLRQALAKLLHGNPLSLKLAATAIGPKPVDPKDLAELEDLTDDTQIQGVLYRRILGHIHEEDVRNIAHPGLILRRITPDIIWKVLAGPCNVKVKTEAEGRRLFRLLKEELALVTPEGNAVRHRTDIRRVMLAPLKKDQKERTEAIQRAAIAYYEPYTDPVSRAEEIYHRLMLDQPIQDIESRWMPGIEDSLRTAIDELTGNARAYLASRLRVELYDADWDAVDQVTWEQYAARRAEDLIRLDRAYDALDVLQRRSTRLPSSQLYWLESRTLRQLGEMRSAREVARRGLAELPSPADLSWLDLFVLFAECEETLGDGVDWAQAPARFATLTERFTGEGRAARFAFAYLRLADRAHYAGIEVGRLISQTLELMERLPDAELWRLEPQLPPQEEFERYRHRKGAPQAAAKQAQVSYALRGYDVGELAEALKEALPTTTDIVNALRSIRIDYSAALRAITGGNPLESVIEWAGTNGKLDEFISSVAAYNPKASSLRRFLTRFAARIDYNADDPFEAVLLAGGRPFFGRRTLRTFLRNVAEGKADPPVLTVNGPKGSGKSYTSEFAHYIAQKTEAFTFASFQLTSHWSLEDVIGTIHARLTWRWDDDYRTEANMERRVALYAEMIVNKARRSRKPTLLLFEREGEPIRPEVLDFIQQLARRASERTPLSLILIEFPFDRAEIELLGELSPEEVAAGISRIAVDTKISFSSTSDIERITDAIVGSAGQAGESYNARVNQASGDILTLLAERSRPVSVMISASHRDEEWQHRLQALLDGKGLTLVGDRLNPGDNWREKMEAALDSAEIIVILVSADYLASTFSMEVEFTRAMERHHSGEAVVIPVLLRTCPWQQTPLRELQMLPSGAKPLAYMKEPDAGLAEVAEAIQRTAHQRRILRNQPPQANIQ